MAYVAISGSLVSDVRSVISNMQRKELAAIGPIPPLDGTEPFIDLGIWGRYLHLKSQMPAEWKGQMTSVRLRIQLEDGAWQGDVNTKNVVEVPPRYSQYSPTTISVHYQDNLLKPVVDSVSQQRDCNARWKKVEEQVVPFLEKCRSLNEALKLWPDLRMYIPREYLDRVERKVERSKADSAAAQEALKNIDTDTVVAAAVIARISRDNET
jgi:hypothetical protein